MKGRVGIFLTEEETCLLLELLDEAVAYRSEYVVMDEDTPQDVNEMDQHYKEAATFRDNLRTQLTGTVAR